MKVEMNREREYLNHVYNIIIDKCFDLARKRIDDLRKDRNFHNYRFEIEYLNDLLKEQEIFYGEKNEKIQEFLSIGKDALFFGENETAYDAFKAGAYVTEYPLFYYMMGKTLYYDYETKEQGVSYLEEYLERHGGSKVYNAYAKLEDYYFYLDEEKSKKYQKKRDKIMLISSINYKRKDKNIIYEEIDEVNKLSKNFEIDKLYELFDNSTDEIKLRIIGELYKRGYKKQADTLYKQNKRTIEKHSKKSRRLVYELDHNRTLFINKGKHDING